MYKYLIQLFSKLVLKKKLKQKKLIIFTGTDFDSFNENSKYLYLYLSKFKKFYPLWVTTNEEIFDYLKTKNLNVIKKKKLFSLLYYFAADILVGTGERFPIDDKYLSNNCIKINLRHGYGPRSNGISFKIEKNKIIKIGDKGKTYNSKLKKWDYINFTNKKLSKLLGAKFGISKKKKVIFGFPRCYQFNNKKKNQDRLYTKNLLNEMGLQVNNNFILYAPTWRLNKKYLPIQELEGFSYYKFNNFLKLKNYIFLINIHSNDNFKIKEYSNIKFIKKNFFFDIYDLLPEIDLLITDYSSIATDYLLLERKIIHLLPDHEEYIADMKLLTDFKEMNCGPIVKDYKNLVKNLNSFQFIKNKKIKKYINFYCQSNKLHYRSIYEFLNKLN
jgi:CDP-glycerol glycerophosphotransferase (TagB/SpsB family)